jgi:hypothetical protein
MTDAARVGAHPRAILIAKIGQYGKIKTRAVELWAKTKNLQHRTGLSDVVA